MPTSKTTNQQVINIIKKHIPTNKAIEMFQELSDVPGNKSFQTSIKSLLEDLKKEK